MAHHIPFHQDTFRPKFIAGNDRSDTPVEFDLSALGAPDQVRLKGLIYASVALGSRPGWDAQIEAGMIDAFQKAPEVFINGVDAVRNLTVPAAMAVKAGVLAELPANLPKDHPVPIVTGKDFARVSVFMPTLAFEVAHRLEQLCDESYIDPRLFEPPSTSPGTPAAPNGSARRARHRPGRTATAAGDRRTASS